jgi:aconitase B
LRWLLVNITPNGKHLKLEKIKTDINESGNITVFTVTGEILADDVVQCVKEYYLGKITLHAIWDLSNADLRHISSSDIDRIAEFVSQYGNLRKGGKTAFVAPEDLGFGISRAYAAISEMKSTPIEVRSFRNLDEAKKWLDIT